MRILMLVSKDAEPDTTPEAEGEIDAWVEEGERRGIRTDGDALESISKQRVVRVRGGKVLVTDGPFVETKELLFGYDLLDCETWDEAVDYASRHPMARAGRLELRALAEF